MPFKRPMGEAAAEGARPPTFVRPLADKRAVVGQQVALECQLDSHPQPAIKWLKDGQNVTQCPDYVVQSDGRRYQLLIAAAAACDSGHFTCQASNSAGSKTSSAMLIVAPAPSPLPGRTSVPAIPPSPAPPQTPVGPSAPLFLKDLQPQALKAGGSVALECRVMGMPVPDIQWYKDGQPLQSGFRYKTEDDPGSGICALTIAMAREEDVGEYSVVAANPHGSAESRAAVLPREAFQEWLEGEQRAITTQKKKSMMVEVQEAIQQPRKSQHPGGFYRPKTERWLDQHNLASQYEAEVEASRWLLQDPSPTPFQQPQGYGQPQHPQQAYQSVSQQSQHSYGGYQTTPSPQPPYQQGAYPQAADATAQAGHYQAAQEQVVAPRIDAPLRSQRLVEGSDARFVALVSGSPAPQLHWLRNGMPIQSSRRFSFLRQGPQAILDIKMVFPEDSGEYSVVAENAGGRATSEAQLQVSSASDMPRHPHPRQAAPRQGPGPAAQPRGPQAPGQPPQQQAPQPPQQPQQRAGPRGGGPGGQAQQRPQTASWFGGTAYGQDASAQSSPRARAPSPIHAPPKFILPSAPQQTIKENQTARIELKVVGKPLPQVQWYFADGSKITDGPKYKLLSSDGVQTLLIVQARPSDSGTYVAVAKNQSGEAECRVTLSVAAAAGSGAPVFVEKFSSVSVADGQAVSLRVRADADPPPSFVWMKDNVELRSGGPFRIEAGQRGESVLRIERATADTAGWYAASAQNPAGVATIRGRVAVAAKAQPAAPQGPDDQQSQQEVVQLRHVQQKQSRQTGKTPVYETSGGGSAPAFTTQPTQLQLHEGQNAHLESRFTPLNDPNLKVAWLHNGRPIEAGSRITTIAEFGFASLDVASAGPADSGTYTCLAVNAHGQAQISSSIVVAEGGPGVVTSSAHHGTLEKMEALERKRTRISTDQRDEMSSKERPNFTADLRNTEVLEGKAVHLEARLAPASDPGMRVEWLKDGRPLQNASRFRILHDFGFVALDLLHTTVQDSGTYTVRATNPLGVAESSAALIIHPIAAISADKTWLAEQDVEELAEAEQLAPKAPVFLSQLVDVAVQEGGRSHFEARFAPQGDPSLTVSWLKDGQPLAHANRIGLQQDFGWASVDIYPSRVDDTGVITCVLRNAVGEAQTSAQLSCGSTQSILSGTQHEHALHHLHAVEGRHLHIGPSPVERPEEEQSLQPPQFVRVLREGQEVAEGQSVHLECRLAPASDPAMKVEWYHNGAPLGAAHRFRPMYDFGYVALDILYAYPEDSGTYTAVARNQLGQAQTESLLVVKGKQSILAEAQHPEGLQRIQALESGRGAGRQEEPDQGCTAPPAFSSHLRDLSLKEGQNLHFELKLSPASDPTMRIEWLHNGRPLVTGSRIRTSFDFGFVSLDILGLIPEDAGTYTLRAYNELGEEETSAQVQVAGSQSVLSDTVHGHSLQRIQHLESMDRSGRREEVEESVNKPPVFVHQLPQSLPELAEGATLHLECQLTPASDNSMTVTWYRDGQPIPAGHRWRTFQDFGFVSLDVLGMNAEDSGVYSCVAKNSVGEAITECQCSCAGKDSVLGQTQHPASVQRISELEAPKLRPSEAPETPKGAPHFVQQLQVPGRVEEGRNVTLECQLLPVDDPQMTVEWFRDGIPLPSGHRFQATKDFGYVCLSILYMYPEDSGTYTCIARNRAGEAETSVRVECSGAQSMFLQSQHPNSLQRIRDLEAPRASAPEDGDAPSQPPVFTVPLPERMENLKEGQTIHLECQLQPIDDPRMRVEWTFNGKTLPASHRFVICHEFGFCSLDLLYAYPEDTGKYGCRAVNAAGEAHTETAIHCIRRKDIYSETQHPESWRKLQEMEGRGKAEPSDPSAPVSPPVFTQQLSGPEQVKEGHSVHFEALVQPIDDPKLKVEWLLNGRPLAAATRIRLVNDFGYVSLDMSHVHPEDSGEYTAVATNAAGQATTSHRIHCAPKKSLYLESQHQKSWRRIQDLETAPAPRTPSPETVFPKPNFTQQINDAPDLQEGDEVRLWCRLEPVGDPSLRVEWLRNGQPIPQGSRFMPARNLDVLTLDIGTVYAEDSGVYSCKAVSSTGEAVTSATLRCGSTEALLLGTRHDEAWRRIQELEAQRPDQPIAADPEPEAPAFVVQLPAQLQPSHEGAPIHLECQVVPTSDPRLSVRWLKDGRPVPDGHRFRTTHDFGYVSLDILYSFPEDSGTWSCEASNALGQAQTHCQLSVLGKDRIVTDSAHPESWDKIQVLEAPKQAPETVADGQKAPPVFTQPLESLERLEGQNAHFECRLTPIDDPELTVEWYKDGQPLVQANRFTTLMDFGLAILSIGGSVPADAGTYTVLARNREGEAQQSATLAVRDKDSLLLDSQHPASLEKIRQLEQAPGPVPDRPDFDISAPVFKSQLSGPSADLIEGQPAHFEGQIAPVTDPNMVVEWFHNGAPVTASSRITSHSDFGLVTLDLHYVLESDAGQWTCRVSNKLGTAESSAALECRARSSVYDQSLHQQSWQQIQAMEAPKEGSPSAPAQTFATPQFTEPLGSVSVPEGQPAVLQARLVPVNDPNLRLEFYHNDAPLRHSNRHALAHDFGLVTMRIAGTVPGDQGTYMCRAVNEQGEAVSTASISLDNVRPNLDLGSAHPESYRKLQEMESVDRFAKPEAMDAEFEKPVFTVGLESVDGVAENETVHLECQYLPTGDPDLTIQWFLNGQPLPQANRLKLGNDFGFATLDIEGTSAHDSGLYGCKVANRHGEAMTSCTLKVEGFERILSQSQHPTAWSRIQELEQPRERHESTPSLAPPGKPSIATHLENVAVGENQAVHLEAVYEPARDNDLVAVWEKNGAPIPAGQLVKTSSDLGVARLDIASANAQHSGMYTLRIRNGEGEAASSCTVHVEGSGGVASETQHGESWTKIQALETPKEVAAAAEAPAFPPPSFSSQLNDVQNQEGQSAHLECNVQPAGDPELKIEWFHNGQPLMAGNKYAISIDFGYCTLDISYCIPEDAGVYMCKATSSQGQAVTSATLHCTGSEAIISSPQQPGAAEKIAALEAGKAAEAEMPEAPRMAPIFTAPLPPNLGDFQEGAAIHLEATVQPVDDPSLTTHWLHNGAPVSASSRMKMINDFGWVILDIAQAEPRDSGEWTVQATNAQGQAVSTTTINVSSRDNIVYQAQQPQSLDKIQDLERPKEAAQPQEVLHNQPPKFIVPLPAFPPLEEGDSVHLEAQVVPVDDPRLRVEWFRDGQPLPSGHRFRPVADFGFCVLDIINILSQDSGRYLCRASNEFGSDTTEAALEVAQISGLLLGSQAPGRAQAVDQLEASLHAPLPADAAQTQKMAPVFLEPLKGPPALREGDSAHFEARLQPGNDPELHVSWFVNGKPLQHGSRVKTICDFGFVVLEISPVYHEDSGTYTAVARNQLGEASTKAEMVCEPRQGVISDSQLPSRMAGAAEKIRHLEAPKGGQDGAVDAAFGPPSFTTQLSDAGDLVEGQLAHLECQLQPANDPRLTVEWFHNGQPLKNSSRMKNIQDFGFVILEIAPAEPQDSGTWECRARNDFGEARTQCTMAVTGRSGVEMSWQVPSSIKKDKINELEAWLRRPKDDPAAPDAVFGAPAFVAPLVDLGTVAEAEPAHFECQLEPIGDPTLRIEWLHNDRPLPYSSRIQMSHDFGFVVLDITSSIGADSGSYTCRATNSVGTAQTTATIQVRSAAEAEAPAIVAPLATDLPQVHEGDKVHLECRVSPLSDPRLSAEWFKDGAPLQNATRYKTMFDFGYVSLDITHAVAEDSGTYECRVRNDHGQAATDTTLSVSAAPSLLLQRQAPEQTDADLERHLRQYTAAPLALSANDVYRDDAKGQAPVFRTELKALGVDEGDFARLEAQLAPVNDPDLRIEWLLNGEPVTMGHRFRSILDFGLAGLDLLYALPDDTGDYVCRAVNKHGTAQTAAKLVVQSKKRIISHSSMPQGSNVKSLSQTEQGLHWSNQKEAGEEARVRSPPTFTIRPKSAQVEEGGCARFECAVGGHPKPRLEWFLNGKLCVSGNRFKLNYDGMYYLVIPQTRAMDAGELVVVARSISGEDQASASLDVLVPNDWRSSRLRPAPHKTQADLQSRESQWRETMMGKLGPAFTKAPRPDFQKLLQVERDRTPPASRESEELRSKFSKKRDDQFYDNLLAAERENKEFSHVEIPSVGLRPAAMSKYEAPKEEMEPVQLRRAPRTTKVDLPQEGPSLPIPVGEQMSEDELQRKFKLRPAAPKEEQLAAKDTVKLRSAKPRAPVQADKVVLEPMRKPLQKVHQRTPPKEHAHLPPSKQIQLRKQTIKEKEPVEPVTLPETQLKKTDIQPKAPEEKATIPAKRVSTTRRDSVGTKVGGKVPKVAPPQQQVKLQSAKRPQPMRGQPTAVAAPKLEHQLTPLAVPVGRPAKFSCKFAVAGPVTVTWTKDGRELASSFEHQIKTGPGQSSLEIARVKETSGGEYTCHVENVGGSTQTTANLQVQAKQDKSSAPAFSSTFPESRVQAGGSVRLDVGLSGYPKPLVSWFKAGSELKPSTRHQMLSEGGTASLIIRDCQPGDSGLIECVARNAKGDVRHSAQLLVAKGPSKAPPQQPAAAQPPAQPQQTAAKAPQILQPMKALIVEEATPAQFTAKIVASPAPTITWFRNSAAVKTGTSFANGVATLSIPSAKAEHEGEYKCVAENAGGKATTAATLKLKAKSAISSSGAPQFSKGLADVVALAGTAAAFTASLSASPPAQAKWLLNGKPAPRDAQASAQGNDHTLSIPAVSAAHVGKWTLRAANKLGLADSHATLKLQTSK